MTRPACLREDVRRHQADGRCGGLEETVMGEGGFTVEEDNLAVLGAQLNDIADFLDGGADGPVNYVEVATDIEDLVSTVKDHLGGARQVPSPWQSEQSSTGTPVPEPGVDEFVGNWEEVRGGIASDLRAVGGILVATDTGLFGTDSDLALQIEAGGAPSFDIGPGTTPAATPVVGEPTFTG
jgi:hypothetical protein